MLRARHMIDALALAADIAFDGAAVAAVKRRGDL